MCSAASCGAPCATRIFSAPSEPAIFRLVPTLVHEMGQAYPELGRAEGLITETLRLEEARFLKTLSRGLGLLEEATGTLTKGDTLDGETAFKLYDTYRLSARPDAGRAEERAASASISTGFTDAMERQRAEARASWAGSGDAATEGVWLTLRDRHGATEFLGYSTDSAEATMPGAGQGRRRGGSLGEGEEGAIVVNQTPFYGEFGGQVGDTGTIESENGARFRVTDTQKKADGLFVHYGMVEVGGFVPGQAVRLTIDGGAAQRDPRQSLGDASSARGAARDARHACRAEGLARRAGPAALRFFASEADRRRRSSPRSRIWPTPSCCRMRRSRRASWTATRDRHRRHGALRREIRRRGARRLDGHGDRGREGRKDLFGRALRRHACRPHRRDRADHGAFGEAAVAAGVRRVEALTGAAARRHLAEQDKRDARDRRQSSRSGRRTCRRALDALIEERRRLERELAEAKKKLAMGGGGACRAGA